MRWKEKLRLRWRSLVRRGRVERELDEELRFHLDEQIAENLAAGMSAEEARYAARRTVGGVEQIKEACRDMRGVSVLRDLGQDVRYGLRMLAKNPGFTAAAVLTLALGIGANTAIFTIADAVLLRLLPVKDPERLVLISRPDKHGGYNGIRYAAFEHLRDHNSVLSGIFGIIMPQTTAVTIDGQAELVNAQIVSGSYYSTLGVSAMLGRTITSQDDRMPEGSSVAVISYGYWERRLHGVSAVIGKKIAINGFPFTIIGVTPPGFFGLMYGEAAHITVPISLQSVMTGRGYLQDTRKDWFVGSIGGRLKPGMSLENARANLDLVFRQTLGPEQQKGEPQLSVVSGSRGFWLIRDRLATPLVILAAMVGLVLLIACANVANLLMVRNAARRKEIAMRLALGVSRPRLIRQLLTECVLLAVLGGAVGLLVAVWTGELLVGLVSRGPFPISFDFHLDARVLGFTGGVSVLVGVLFGLVPVARATKVDLTIDLKAAGGRGGSPMGFDLGRILIVAQVAVSLLMLVGAGLFVRTLRNLRELDPGFDMEKVLVFSIEPTLVGYQDVQLRKLYEEILEQVRGLPMVHTASLSRLGELTLGGLATRTVSVPGYVPLPNETPEIHANFVGPNFFETMGMALTRGRDFLPQDNQDAPNVAVINETAARRFFGSASPIGRRITIDDTPDEFELVGIVRDAKYQSLRENHISMLFLPCFQFPPDHLQRMTYEVRTAGNPASVVAAVRKQIQRIDPNIPLYNVRTLTEQANQSLMPERLVATLASLFGLLALVLVCVGLYGIMAYRVGWRTQEIGVRMALGAERGNVIRMVLREALLLVSMGVAVGVPVALALARLVASLLYGLKAGDAGTIWAVVGLLVLVAAVASYLPARRASRVDPMAALRCE